MRTLYTTLLLSLLVLSVIPGVLANDTNVVSGVDITTENFAPLVWGCGARVVIDDSLEMGRITDSLLWERTQSYAFTGEKIHQVVLVMDKNGIDKVNEVYAAVGDERSGNDVEANCIPVDAEISPSECNARILEEEITEFDSATMGYYVCILNVEPTMYGNKWITVEATDLDGEMGVMAEAERWFLNPVIALTTDGSLTFENVRPGTSSYSDTMLVTNDADTGSGVMLDMFVSGTDFYDSSSSGAKCPVSNVLDLDAFSYFAANGAYSTLLDSRSDTEGYVQIAYGDSFSPLFYGNNEIMQTPVQYNGYAAGNILAPGASMALTFRLNLPEPCNGDFDTGSIYFWGEAI